MDPNFPPAPVGAPDRGSDPTVLRQLAGDMERSLLDLQGPLDTIELLVDGLDVRNAAALAWLVSAAARATGELRGQWERLHEMASPAGGR